MAIQQVRAQINGQWYILTYDSASGKYKTTITAPGKTSFTEPGGYYSVRVEVSNAAGTVGSADATTITGLRLQVKERVKPIITILSPSAGAYVTNSKQPVVFTVVDEVGGSGINIGSLVVKQDGNAVPGSAITKTAITNGYSAIYTPQSALSDGSHTVTVDVADNDGNAADQKSTTYKVDTVPPVLNVASPAEGLITASNTVNVSGKTNDVTSSPVTVKISVNGANQGGISVNGDGTFSKAVSLQEGKNTITVTATDAAGKSSSVTREVILDTSVPEIISAAIVPNPVDAGATMVITVEVSG